MELKNGDLVDCLVKESVIVRPHQNYDEIITLEIIAIDNAGYHLYVPGYRFLRDSKTLDSYACKRLKIKDCFLGEQSIIISDNFIFKINTIYDGCFCKRCGEFYNMAAPNQSNGELICWACKSNPYR